MRLIYRGNGTNHASAPRLPSVSRYRPRVLTVLVLIVAAALITLANLRSDDKVEESSSLNFTHKTSTRSTAATQADESRN